MAFQQQRPPQGGRQEAMNKTPRFADILDTAWSQHGLKRVSTKIEQFPTEENGWTTIVHATVETDRGEFSAIGDANPKNAGPMIAPHSIRFAESRAIARALRWATNAGEAIDVEMGDYHPEPAPRAQKTEQAPAPYDVDAQAQRQAGIAQAAPASGRNPALAGEWETAQKAQRALRNIGVTPPMLPPDDASKADLVSFVADCRSIYEAKKPQAAKA